MELLGTYTGEVIVINDPQKLGRVKVRVPLVYGPVGGDSGFGNISDDDIPWALPAGLAAGHNKQSGGISWLPVKGDHVWVRFLDGEPEKPVWEWGNQYLTDPATFPLNTYATPAATPTPSPDRVSKTPPAPEPIKRAALTRYGHILEIIPTQLLIATQNAYSMTLVDSTAGVPIPDGYISIRTLLGNNIEMYDDQSLIWINSLNMFMANFQELSFNGALHWHAASFSWQVASQNQAYIYAKTYFGADSAFSALMGDNAMVSSRNTLWLTANSLIEMTAGSMVQIGAAEVVNIGSASTTVSAENWLALASQMSLTMDAQQVNIRSDLATAVSSNVDLSLIANVSIDMGSLDIAIHADTTAQVISPYIALQTAPNIASPGSYVMVQPAQIDIDCAGRHLSITPGGFFFF